MPTSALLAVVPEAEPYVEHLRQQYDPVASLGMPAHITLTVPFMPPDLIAESELEVLEQIFGAAAPFEFTLSEVRCFPETAYLSPSPPEPFVDLVERILARFPEYPPYGGIYSEAVPHLTIADKSARFAAEAKQIVSETLAVRGPIVALCTKVDLYEDSSGTWSPFARFKLGRGAA